MLLSANLEPILIYVCFTWLLQEEEGWWEGMKNGKIGMFPSNFVDVIEENAEDGGILS